MKSVSTFKNLIKFLCCCLATILQEEKEENDSSAFDELGRLGEEMGFLSEGETSVTERKRKAKNTVKQRPEKQRIQYSTRGKKYSYCEPEVPDDDHYICKFSEPRALYVL